MAQYYCRSMVLLSCASDRLDMEQPLVIQLEPYHSLKLKMDLRWTNTWDHGLQLFFGFVAFLLQLVALYQGPVHLPFPKWFKIFSKYFLVLLLKYGCRKHFKTQNHTGWYLWDWTIISIWRHEIVCWFPCFVCDVNIGFTLCKVYTEVQQNNFRFKTQIKHGN